MSERQHATAAEWLSWLVQGAARVSRGRLACFEACVRREERERVLAEVARLLADPEHYLVTRTDLETCIALLRNESP